MRLITQGAFACAVAATLTACSESPEPAQEQSPAEQGGEAAGDVLGGTISDDMIALEALTSQSPTVAPQRPSPVPQAEGDGEGDSAPQPENAGPPAAQPPPAR